MKLNIRFSYFVLICCLLSIFTATAQTHKKWSTSNIFTNQLYNIKVDYVTAKYEADSLLHILNSTPDDTSKVLLLLKISEFQLSLPDTFNNFNQARFFALKAKALSDKLNYKYGSALSLQTIGFVYEKRKDFKTAIDYYKQALNKVDFKEYALRDRFFSRLLNADFYIGNYTDAMDIVDNEMKTAEKINDKIHIANCNNLFGFIFFREENYEEAEKYYQLYIANSRELKDSILLIHALGETADLYIQQKDTQKSLATLNEALNICNALLNTTNQKGSVAYQKNKLMYRLSKVYQLANNLPKALQYALVTINFSKINPVNLYDGAEYYINAGSIYKEMGEYKNAIDYLNDGFNLANEIGHKEDIKDAAQQLSQLYVLEKKFDSAFFFYKLYNNIKDSIVNNEAKMKIAEIQGKYDLAKKNEEIINQQKLRNIIIGTFILVLLLLLIFYYTNNLKQKNKLQQEKYNQQQELFNAIITTQDKERKRIAQDIHDRVGSLLSAAKINLSSIEENKTTKDLLDEASVELRNIAHNIMPATLSKLGLVSAMKNLVGNLSSHTNMQINFSTYGMEERLNESMEINIYQIILELISNIIKHAQATSLTIQIIQYDNHLNVMIEDNGCGFDYQKQMKERKGIGLANILSRVENLKGTIHIDSEENEGTTISIEIPKTKP